MWLARDGQRVEVPRERGPVEVRPGDAALLFTGAADGTPDGPGSGGTLQWTFHAGAGAAAAAAPALEVTEAAEAAPAVPKASGFWSMLTGGH